MPFIEQVIVPIDITTEISFYYEVKVIEKRDFVADYGNFLLIAVKNENLSNFFAQLFIYVYDNRIHLELLETFFCK